MVFACYEPVRYFSAIYLYGERNSLTMISDTYIFTYQASFYFKMDLVWYIRERVIDVVGQRSSLNIKQKNYLTFISIMVSTKTFLALLASTFTFSSANAFTRFGETEYALSPIITISKQIYRFIP